MEIRGSNPLGGAIFCVQIPCDPGLPAPLVATVGNALATSRAPQRNRPRTRPGTGGVTAAATCRPRTANQSGTFRRGTCRAIQRSRPCDVPPRSWHPPTSSPPSTPFPRSSRWPGSSTTSWSSSAASNSRWQAWTSASAWPISSVPGSRTRRPATTLRHSADPSLGRRGASVVPWAPQAAASAFRLHRHSHALAGVPGEWLAVSGKLGARRARPSAEQSSRPFLPRPQRRG